MLLESPAMSDTNAQSIAPPCTRCGARKVEKMSDKDVVLWICAVCGHIWGEARTESK